MLHVLFVCLHLAIVILDNQTPESKDLQRFLTDYCKHWRGTGLQLGLKSSVLDQVEADYHTLSERFRVTLEKWLQLNVGVTWANLELAITNANRENLGLQPLTTGKEMEIFGGGKILANHTCKSYFGKENFGK